MRRAGIGRRRKRGCGRVWRSNELRMSQLGHGIIWSQVHSIGFILSRSLRDLSSQGQSISELKSFHDHAGSIRPCTAYAHEALRSLTTGPISINTKNGTTSCTCILSRCPVSLHGPARYLAQKFEEREESSNLRRLCVLGLQVLSPRVREVHMQSHFLLDM